MLKFSGFVGHSYLVHNLNTNNKTVQDGVDIEIQFKTRHSEGRYICYLKSILISSFTLRNLTAGWAGRENVHDFVH